MSRSRRNFSAEFKTNLVLQLLKGEKELNVLAVENDIQPNLLRNWKKEFLTNASLAFDNKREDNLREKLAEERKEKAEYAKKVGQLTMQVDWLKNGIRIYAAVDICIRISLAWSDVDRSMIMKHGFLYLTAIIDTAVVWSC